MKNQVVTFQPIAKRGKTTYQLSDQSFHVKTSMGLDIKRLARHAGICKISSRIKTKHFQQYSEPILADYRLIWFQKEIVEKNITAILRELDYQPATLLETLSCLLLMSQMQRIELLHDRDLVALGSHWLDEREKLVRIPFVHKMTQLRLSLGHTFNQHDLFLIRPTIASFLSSGDS
jgi:hypothetical protein